MKLYAVLAIALVVLASGCTKKEKVTQEQYAKEVKERQEERTFFVSANKALAERVKLLEKKVSDTNDDKSHIVLQGSQQSYKHAEEKMLLQNQIDRFKSDKVRLDNELTEVKGRLQRTEAALKTADPKGERERLVILENDLQEKRLRLLEREKRVDEREKRFEEQKKAVEAAQKKKEELPAAQEGRKLSIVNEDWRSRQELSDAIRWDRISQRFAAARKYIESSRNR